MAVSSKESKQNIDSLLSQGVPQELISNYGDKLNPNESERILSAFRATGNPYSASNISSSITNPALPPDYSDPLGYRTRLESEVGLTDAQKQYQASIQGLREFDTNTDAVMNQIEDQPLNMGVITGQQASQARLRSNMRDSKVNETEAFQDFLLAKNEEVNKRYGIYENERSTKTQLILNNPGAQIKYTDTIEQASKKLEDYAVQAKKDAYKDSLKAVALQMGISTKGKSTKDLEKKISKTNKKALKQAQQEADLKLEALKTDIANTKSLISERGKTKAEDTVPIYTVNDNGDVIQASDQSGNPIMVPKGAIINRAGKTEESSTVDFSSDQTQEQAAGGGAWDWFKGLWQ